MHFFTGQSTFHSPPARCGVLDFNRALLFLRLLCLLTRRLLQTASSRSQWALPNLNRQLQIPVGTAGPQRPDRMPEDMPDGMSDRMPKDMSDRMPEDMPDRMPEDMSDRMPEDMPDRMPEDLPDRMPEDMPDRMPEDMPDRMLDRMPEDLPDRMPEDMPEHMPEDMPDRMPEDMSDRMPEDLPVRKCINVMVGVTRSKAFFFVIWMFGNAGRKVLVLNQHFLSKSESLSDFPRVNGTPQKGFLYIIVPIVHFFRCPTQVARMQKALICSMSNPGRCRPFLPYLCCFCCSSSFLLFPFDLFLFSFLFSLSSLPFLSSFLFFASLPFPCFSFSLCFPFLFVSSSCPFSLLKFLFIFPSF